MLIQSTKKLLDELPLKPEPHAEEEPLFSWHANLIKVRRRKAVALMNDSNLYVLVLYGLQARHFKKLDEYILQAIRDTFQEEAIKEEIIEQFTESSRGVSFTRTNNRSMVARLNNACRSVFFFAGLLDGKAISQPVASKNVSRDLIGAGINEFVRPNEELYRDLEAFYGGPVICTEALQIKVTLDLENHHVWRRLIVPVFMTFNQFHEVLQTAFGWRDYHLHEFFIYGRETVDPSDDFFCLNHPAYHREGLKPLINVACEEQILEYDCDVPVMRESGIRLSECSPAPMKYIYDFGDFWQHYIEVEKIIRDYDKNYPVCLGGEGNAPPEDVGGSSGYEEFLEIIADKTNPEHQGRINWGRGQGYRDFDLESINRILEHM